MKTVVKSSKPKMVRRCDVKPGQWFRRGTLVLKAITNKENIKTGKLYSYYPKYSSLSWCSNTDNTMVELLEPEGPIILRPVME